MIIEENVDKPVGMFLLNIPTIGLSKYVKYAAQRTYFSKEQYESDIEFLNPDDIVLVLTDISATDCYKRCDIKVLELEELVC